MFDIRTDLLAYTGEGNQRKVENNVNSVRIGNKKFSNKRKA